MHVALIGSGNMGRGLAHGARPVVSAYAQTVVAVGPRHADASTSKLAINYSRAGLLEPKREACDWSAVARYQAA